MPSNEDGAGERDSSVPSMLDLVRLSRKRLFPPGGVELYRQIALLTEMSPELEVLDVASGKGVPLEYFVTEFGVRASGVDIDPAMVDEAEEWSRELGAGQRLQFQSGRSDALPYRDEIFDVAIGEIGLANHCSPEDAVRELVRVTKPGGFIVLVQLVWKAPVETERRVVLSEHLGARPLMVVEWKRLLREAGVQDVHVEDWSDEETAFRPIAKPFPDFAELFTVGERITILQRAWKRWGLKGVSAAVARENEVHKLLTSERILGLDLLRGRKVGGPERTPEMAGAGGGAVEGREATPERDGGRPGAPESASTPDAGAVGQGDEDAASQRNADAQPREGDAQPREGDAQPREGDAQPREGDAQPREGEAGSAETERPDRHSDTAGLPLFGDDDTDDTGESDEPATRVSGDDRREERDE